MLALSPYRSARDEFEGEASVFLDANENPFNSDYNRYPDPHQRQLKQALTTVKGVSGNQIFLGNGSDEAIDLLFRIFCEPGRDTVIIPQPTYGMYQVSAAINNITVAAPRLTTAFDIDVHATLAAANGQAKMLFLCSPNNPSGNLLSREKIIELLNAFNGIVVIDEAYIDFAPEHSFVPDLAHYRNLVVLQTLSKAWGLAGLRLGMAFAHRDIIELLNKVKPPYNINTLTQQVVWQQLHQPEEMQQHVQLLIAERQRLVRELQSVSCVRRVYPSQANFLLVKMNDARSIYQQLVKQGIVVRDRSNVILCDNCLRITIGTPEENNQLLSRLLHL